MSEDFEDNRGLIDDDPALDYILYEEMNKEDGGPVVNGLLGSDVGFLPADPLFYSLPSAI